MSDSFPFVALGALAVLALGAIGVAGVGSSCQPPTAPGTTPAAIAQPWGMTLVDKSAIEVAGPRQSQSVEVSVETDAPPGASVSIEVGGKVVATETSEDDEPEEGGGYAEWQLTPRVVRLGGGAGLRVSVSDADGRPLGSKLRVSLSLKEGSDRR